MEGALKYCLVVLLISAGVFGVPYRRYELDNDSQYNVNKFDVVYDQRQNGTENYKLNVDGLSLVWSPNSLLAAAALLEPALYGEYPDTNVDIFLGPDDSKPEETSSAKPGDTNKPEQNSEKPTEENPGKPIEAHPSPTILVIDGNQLSEQKPEDVAAGSRRKLRLPGLIRPFLRRRSSVSQKINTT